MYEGDVDVGIVSGKIRGQTFGAIHRAMTATRTSERYLQITESAPLVGLDRGHDQTADILHEFLHLSPLLKEIYHGAVASRQRFIFFVTSRICLLYTTDADQE